MGAFGWQTFENDAALDWIETLSAARDASVLTRAFADAGQSRDPDPDRDCCCLAAAEVVAALCGRGSPDLPAEVVAWVQQRFANAAPFLEQARHSVKCVLADSELSDLWSESDHHELWRAAVADLLSRLSAGDGLRERAERFLTELVPFEGYSSESVTEDAIRHYIANGSWDAAEWREDLRLCYSAVLDEMDEGDFSRSSVARQEYLRGCADLLREIMLEVFGAAEREDLG